MLTSVRNCVLALAVALNLGISLQAQSGHLKRITISSASMNCGSASYALSGTAGEAVIGKMNSSNYVMSLGATSMAADTSSGPEVCCTNLRGNVDGDAGDNTDISDLTYYVDFMFGGGPEPPCSEEADINADGSEDISDLTALVSYMFGGGPAPFACGASAPVMAKLSTPIILHPVLTSQGLVLMLETDQELRGIEVSFSGHLDKPPALVPTNGVELFSDIQENNAKIGILDIDGTSLLAAGKSALVRLSGDIEVVSATAADLASRSRPVQIAPMSKEEDDLPDDYNLDDNYPNPFNPVTTITFALPKASDVTIDVFNTIGRKVATLVDRRMEAGRHTIEWDSRSSGGKSVASGVYFYRIRANNFTSTKKMLLLK